MTRRLKTMIFALQLEAALISASCFAVQKPSVFTRTGKLRSLLGKKMPIDKKKPFIFNGGINLHYFVELERGNRQFTHN